MEFFKGLLAYFTFGSILFAPGIIAGAYDIPTGFILWIVVSLTTSVFAFVYGDELSNYDGAAIVIFLSTAFTNLIAFAIISMSIEIFGSKIYLSDINKLHNVEKYVDSKHAIVTDDNIIRLSGEDYWKLKSEKCVKLLETDKRYYNQFESINSKKFHHKETPIFECFIGGEMQ